MILESWSTYLPPPGSRYRVLYIPDAHASAPDLQAFGRSLDSRPGVALKSVQMASVRANTISAEVQIFLGDSPLVTALGTFHSDGANFWRVSQVERIDDGVPNQLTVTVQRVLDSALDPVQDFATAGGTALAEVTSKVRSVGLPSVAIIGAAALAFVFFKR